MTPRDRCDACSGGCRSLTACRIRCGLTTASLPKPATPPQPSRASDVAGITVCLVALALPIVGLLGSGQ